MKIKFTDLKIKTDKGKAIPELVHDYHPFAEDEDLKDVYVKCRHMTNGASSKYVTFNDEGKMSVDFKSIFFDHAVSIHGITFEVDGREFDITDPEDLKKWPTHNFIENIISRTAIHIYQGSSLTQEEILN